MARAEHPADTRRHPTLSSESFRSATSYASFRSCRSIKSVASSNRASFKSVLSRQNSYYSCGDPDTEADNVRAGLVNEGFQDNISFYSCNDVPVNTNQLPVESEVAPRLRSSVSENVLQSFDEEVWSKDRSGENKHSPGSRKFLSVLALLLAGVAVSGSTAAQTLSPSLPPWVIIVFRSSLQLLVSICLLVVLRCHPLGPPGTRWKVLLTGLLSSFLLATTYLSLTRLDPRLTAAVLLSAVPVVTFLSSLVTREHVGLYRLLSLAVFIAGALVVSRPFSLTSPVQSSASQLHQDLAQHNIYGFPVQFSRQDPPVLTGSEVDVGGVLACLASVLITSLLFLLTRSSREAPVCVLLFWTSLGGLVMGGIGLYTLGYDPHNQQIFREGREVSERSQESPNTTITTTSAPFTDTNGPLKFPNRMFDGVNEWLVGSLISVLGIFATAMLIKAVQSVEPGRAILIKSTEIITSYILVASLNSLNSLDWLDSVGVVLVFLAVAAASIEDKLVNRERWRWF